MIDPETATPADFPRWHDPECPHPNDRLQRDGLGDICQDCGKLFVRWR